MNYNEIRTRYTAKADQARSLRDELQRKMNEAKAKAIHYHGVAARKMSLFYHLQQEMYETTHVSWLNELVIPLIREVNRRTGLHFDVSDLHTFGLRSECPVFDKTDKGHSLVFTPETDERFHIQLWIDTGKTSDNFAKNTIGEINGMNNVSEKVESVETVIDNLRRRYPEDTLLNPQQDA